MQGYDQDGNDIRYKYVKSMQSDHFFVAVDSIRRAKLAGVNRVMSHFARTHYCRRKECPGRSMAADVAARAGERVPAR